MASQQHGNTVFMTEQESERIRNIAKNRLKKCSELAGNARERRDATAAKQQATGASLMADMGAPDPDLAQTKGRAGTFPALPVGQVYPPCVVPLEDLQPIKLADLRMETHHRGRRLTVKRASPVVPLIARPWTMVREEGEEEDMERLELCLHKSRHGEEVLESASSYIIKEPYFTLTDQGEPTIRVDHPSDLIVCRDEIGSAKDATDAEKVAKNCKDKGNSALEKNKLALAHAKYTEGLKAARQGTVSEANPDLARDLFRNRAHANLLLNQLDEAKSDAKAALIGKEDERSKDLDSKAYFRAGSAAYNLGEYREAKGFFEEQLNLSPDNKTAIAYLKNIEVRIREQETGAYNFKKIRANLSRARPRVDAASFLSNTKVEESKGRGRGLFATRDIPAGEIVICEKAFCVVWGHDKEALTAMTYDVRDDRIRVSPVGLSKAIVQKLLSNPSQVEKVMDLYGDYAGDGTNVSKTEDGPVVDTFRIHDIVSRNAFGPGSQFGDEGVSNASTGLWIWAAYINHSCVANAKKEYVGDLMVVRATRAIAAGEEIFHSYDESGDFDARRAALATTWGFECGCPLCAAEKTDSSAARKKRRDLADDADQFVATEHYLDAKRLAVSKAKRLLKAIEDTYDGDKYKDLPRLATRRIQEWLALANQKR
ncbi:SET domain-containing protein [Daldinia caldariorum]|uniref:SET domain-containing protein n=1 Tax=Daldinia caldariorum TaxID=326644 RepID=UPI002008644F|nr:SET domain-containing protein [Daldinia caldariorum]KAI1463417.1 SET domain-containing protein [Daldinia caldariorum]